MAGNMGKIVGGAITALVVAGGGAALWAHSATNAKLTQTWNVHAAELPVPFPLTEAELAELRAEKLAAQTAAAGAEGAAPVDPAAAAADPAAAPADPLAGMDLAALATERAVARGKHLLEARYACVECHGQDFGGGTMMDGMPVARLFGPNLTTGEGSVTKDYTIADWDRIVRHGVRKDGTGGLMPSEDFVNMSDRELSDIVAYIRSLPPVDKPSQPREIGPVGVALVATGKLALSAERHPDHAAAHAVEPPAAADDATFGKHLATVCVGCHRADFSGGPILAGDPSWPPAMNLTPHETGLKGWTYEDFVTVMREGKRKDGAPLKPPMSLIPPYAQKMTDTELRAMWTYLSAVEAKPTGS